MHHIRPILLFVLVTVLFIAAGQTAVAKVFPSYIRITQDYSNAPFDGSFADGSGAAIRFYLNQVADSVIVTIIPAAGGSPIATIKKAGLSAGDNVIYWNGTTTPKVAAPAGAYKAVVTAYHGGYASYTELSVTGPSIYTRGVTCIKNPALRWFGFIYSVSGGGYATGLVRHASDGRQWGNKPDSAFLSSTGVTIPGTPSIRWAPTADLDGYVYLIGNTDRRIYRFHVDTLNVTLFDSSAYGMRIQGLDVRGTGSAKTLYVTGDSAVFKVAIGMQTFNTAPPQKLVTVGTYLSKNLVFWDAKVAEDNSLYVIYRADSAIGTLPVGSRGILKFNLATGSLPKTLADTVWTARMADGDPVTLALWDGPTTAASDDILYMSHDVGTVSTTEISGLYAFTNLDAAKPTRAIAWADPDNNASSSRSTVITDVVGNLIYFENSNEQVVLVAPPSGPNSYALTSLDTLKITAPGYVVDLVSMAAARIDANLDGQPDRLGDTLRVIGVINSVNIQTTQFGYFFQDSTGGMEIFSYSLVGAPSVGPGCRVMTTGVIGFYRGTTEIMPANLATDVVILDTGNVITPIPLTIGQYKANPEFYESRRIQITVANPLDFTSAQWPAAGASANLNIWNGIDTLILRLDSDTEIPGSTYPTFPVKITGVATQFTTSATVYNNGYQITPIFIADFVPVNAPPVAKFALLEPAKGSRVVLNDTAQVVTFRWKSALDFNGDLLLYQWIPVGKTSVPTGNSAHDTLLARTGKQLLTYLGTADSVVLKWTVAVKDANPAVYNTDTSTVTLVRGTITGVNELDMIPNSYSLAQNYPNPFNPSTTIRFGLPQASNVTLRLYDALGREVATLLNEQRPAGYVQVVWNGTNKSSTRVASGVYFYRIEARPVDGGQTFVELKKMLLIK
jgi:flagellar hook assembly protein FlgD